MKQIFFCALIFWGLTACNNGSSSSEGTAGLADSLFDAVMKGHDVAMPKMNKLERLQRETRAAIDSIANLPATQRKNLAAHSAALDSALKALDYGDLSMSAWMMDFKYDSFKNDDAKRVPYLQNELEKVNKMKDAVLGSIALADSLLAKPFPAAP